MVVSSETVRLDPLEPGDDFFCEHCSQHSRAVLKDSFLECMICLVQVQEYDLVDHDRVQLDEEGKMSGRGSPVRIGQRPSRTVIGASSKKAGNGKSWNYLRKVDGGGRDGGPTRKKKEAIRLIQSHSTTKGHERRALELLDLGWPDKRQSRPNRLALKEPIWRSAHPHGVGCSAAACLHIAAEEMGFDLKFETVVGLCLPTAENPVSFGFRSLKRMRKILHDSLGRGRRMSSDNSARAILSRANLGETIYGGISSRIWEHWGLSTLTGDNLENHPRQLLAAICHLIAMDEGLPVRPTLIQDRFNVGRSYQNWISKVSFKQVDKPPNQT